MHRMLFAVSMVALWLPAQAGAQTYGETAAYLASVVNTDEPFRIANGDSGRSFTENAVRFDEDCVMSIDLQYSGEGPTLWLTEVTNVEFANLENAVIDVWSGSTTERMINGPIVNLVSRSTDMDFMTETCVVGEVACSTEPNFRASIGLSPDTVQDADAIETALRHLTTLCGGTIEPRASN